MKTRNLFEKDNLLGKGILLLLWIVALCPMQQVYSQADFSERAKIEGNLDIRMASAPLIEPYFVDRNKVIMDRLLVPTEKVPEILTERMTAEYNSGSSSFSINNQFDLDSDKDVFTYLLNGCSFEDGGCLEYFTAGREQTVTYNPQNEYENLGLLPLEPDLVNGANRYLTPEKYEAWRDALVDTLTALDLIARIDEERAQTRVVNGVEYVQFSGTNPRLRIRQKAYNATCGPVYGNPKTEKMRAGLLYSDNDDDNTTFCSSSSRLEISECAKIEYAFLYWFGMDGTSKYTYDKSAFKSYGSSMPGSVDAEETRTVKFKSPNMTAYQDVVAEDRYSYAQYDHNNTYVCVADVTNMVKGSEAGDFWVANVKTVPDKIKGGTHGGWVLVVVFNEPDSPPRSISIWDGMQNVGNNSSTSFQLTGLTTPASDDFTSYIGYAALDGENLAEYISQSRAKPEGLGFNAGNGTFSINPNPMRKLYGRYGYPLDANKRAIVNECNVPDFDSPLFTESYQDGISSLRTTTYVENVDGTWSNGNPVVRTPNYNRTFSYDAHHIRLPEGCVNQTATEATLTVNAGPQGNTIPFLAYIAIETVQPFFYITKKTDVAESKTDKELEYVIVVKNNGGKASNPSGDFLFDTLDVAVDYVDGSLVSSDNRVTLESSAGSPSVLKFGLPSIEVKDSIVLKFKVKLKDITDPVWQFPICKRRIENSAVAKYYAPDGSLLVGISNQTDCKTNTATIVRVEDELISQYMPVDTLGPFKINALDDLNVLNNINKVLKDELKIEDVSIFEGNIYYNGAGLVHPDSLFNNDAVQIFVADDTATMGSSCGVRYRIIFEYSAPPVIVPSFRNVWCETAEGKGMVQDSCYYEPTSDGKKLKFYLFEGVVEDEVGFAASAPIDTRDFSENLTYRKEKLDKGSYSIVVEDAEGKRYFNSFDIEVETGHEPKPVIEAATQLCEGESLNLLAKDTSASVLNRLYEWSGVGLDKSTGAEVVFNGDGSQSPGSYDFTVKVTDDSLCVAESTVTVVMNEKPAAPESVELNMQQAEGEKESIAPAVKEVAPNKLKWYMTEDAETGSFDPILQDKTVAGTYTYYVSNVSPEGCESERVPVVVVVNQTPVPVVRDSAVCFGEGIADLSALVSKDKPEFKLYWYASETAETGSAEMVSLDKTAAPGVYKYHVTQKDEAKNSESDKATFSVTVYGVKEPETTDLSLCANDVVPDFEVKTSKDEAGYYYGDGLQWFENGAEIQKTPIPSTNVASSVVYNYAVAQVYTLPNGSVCMSDTVSLDVAVNKVPMPSVGDFDVSYLKTDAAGSPLAYASLLEQNPDVAKADDGLTLVWYDANKVLIGSDAPAPKYDASISEDAEENYTYYVSQKDADGCESDLRKVTVTITRSPRPKVSPIDYCEGAAAEPLTAAVNVSGLPDAADYKLFWFDADGNALSAAPVPSTELPDLDKNEVSVSYFVAQGKVDGALSGKSEIVVTVYAKPRLSRTETESVCERSVDINQYWTVSNNVQGFKSEFKSADNSQVQNPAAVEKGGVYSVSGYFTVPLSGAECRSDELELNVRIDSLRDVSVDGPARACPGDVLELTAVVGASNVDDVKFAWNGVAGEKLFKTDALAGEKGVEYSYEVEVSAGACVKKALHKVVMGDGSVAGSVLFEEKDNLESPLKLSASSANMRFYSCGGTVSVDLSGLKSGDGLFEVYENGELLSEGSKLELKGFSGERSFKVSYRNECPASLDFTVASLPINVALSHTDLVICEGEEFSAVLDIDCEEKPAVLWLKDGHEIASSESVKIEKAKADDSGLYGFKLTNRGCVVEKNLSDELKVKEFVEFSVPKDLYVLQRGESVEIGLSVSKPQSGMVDKIEWREKGLVVSDEYRINVVADRDHLFEIELSDEDYCSVTDTVEVWADALISLKIDVADSICLGNYTVLTIDTSGTGRILNPEEYELNVWAQLADEGTPKEVSYESRNGVFRAEVSPFVPTLYNAQVTYKGHAIVEQALVVPTQPVEVKMPTDLKVCDGEEVDIEISYTPAEAVLSWAYDASVLNVDGGYNIVALPSFNEETAKGHTSKYVYTLNADWGKCGARAFEAVVLVDEPFDVDVVSDTVCEGEMVNISADKFGADKFEWKEELSGDVVCQSSTFTSLLSETSYYDVKMYRGECEAETKAVAVVNSAPRILSVDSLDIRRVEVVLEGHYGLSPFLFKIDDGEADEQSEKDGLSFGKHIVYVEDGAGCKDEFEFVINVPDIRIPDYFSPDGDGVNETWVVSGLQEAFPDANVSVFDRFGKLLLTYKGADEGWDGTYNGTLMPSTDYWYEIDVKEIGKKYVGHFTLLRQ